MKHTLLILSLSATCSASELRVVGGREVNITPVVEWFQNHKGERPMKHWKEISFENYLGLVNGGHCFDSVIDGQRKTILLQNPPSDVIRMAKRLRELETQAGRATFVNHQAQAQKTFHESRESGGYFASGSPEFVNAVAAQENQLKQNAANAKAFAMMTQAQKDEIDGKIKSERSAMAAKREFSMFTGRVILQKELWDCGR